MPSYGDYYYGVSTTNTPYREVRNTEHSSRSASLMRSLRSTPYSVLHTGTIITRSFRLCERGRWIDALDLTVRSRSDAERLASVRVLVPLRRR